MAIAAAVALTSTAAFAGATVHGSPRAVIVEASNSSIEDILAALGKSFDIRVNSTTDLNKQLNGTYEGSLTQVVTRVLEGYNFIVKSSNGHLMVSVLGSRAGTAVAHVATPPAARTASTAAPAQAAAAPAAAPAPVAVAKNPAADRDPAKEQAALAKMPLPILLAEGPKPPMPTPSTETTGGPVPIMTPSNVAAPMPAPSSQASAPMPIKSDAMPNVTNLTSTPFPPPLLTKPNAGGSPATTGEPAVAEPKK
jgi:hypothetical protein